MVGDQKIYTEKNVKNIPFASGTPFFSFSVFIEGIEIDIQQKICARVEIREGERIVGKKKGNWENSGWGRRKTLCATGISKKILEKREKAFRHN